MRWSPGYLLLLAPTLVLAQEGPLHADFRGEGTRVASACEPFGFKTLPGCGYELFSDHPLHITAGSLPPQNGFAGGAAFAWARDTTSWRLSANVDAVGGSGGAWRAGGYLKMIHTPKEQIHVVIPTAGTPAAAAPKKTVPLVHPYTVLNLYAQSISLDKLNFFGLGNDTTLAGASVFGMSETIAGGNVIKPVFEWAAIRNLNLALLGEVHGRMVSIRGETGQSTPSIDSLYTNATAPGLSSQPAFAQFGEGLRIQPEIGSRLQLNYLGNFQQFVAPSNAQFSFRRWTADLNHTFSLYSQTQPGTTSDTKGPDQCADDSGTCPPIPHSRNLEGSIGVRVLLSESIADGSSSVPFYFQETLGGSDINSALALGSYQDYRFRAPNLLLLQENVEHSVWGPLGLAFTADQGEVALTRGDPGFSDLKHSFAAGLTLRAGAFPLVSLMFAWGGPEGHHTIANMNTSLLGGSSRPPLD